MKWRLEIVHTTKYTYQEDVYSSYNEVRMTPKNTSNQLLLSSSIAVSPRASLYNYFDYFGTAVTYFDLHRRHNNLDITSSSHVEIEDPRTRGVRLSPIEMSDPSFMDAFSEYLTTTTYTQVSNGVASQIQSSVSSVETAEDRLSKVVEFVRENLHYRSGITMVSSSASEALDIGFGVCQDFAHVTIALKYGLMAKPVFSMIICDPYSASIRARLSWPRPSCHEISGVNTSPVLRRHPRVDSR